jgi:hypothetical protein
VLSGTPIGAGLAGYAAGTSLGQAGNAFAEEQGFLGERNRQYEDSGNRNWSDLVADSGRWTRDKLGGGIPGQVAGGVVMHKALDFLGPAAAISGAASAATTAGNFLYRNAPVHRLLDGVGGVTDNE